MRVINVIEVEHGSVLGVTSFGVYDEQLSQDVVDEAETHYKDCCQSRENEFDKFDEEEDMDNGSWTNGNGYEVSIVWSDI